jgi:hypothetical protein
MGLNRESRNEVPVVPADVEGSSLVLLVEWPNTSDKDREDIIDVCDNEVAGGGVDSALVFSGVKAEVVEFVNRARFICLGK